MPTLRTLTRQDARRLAISRQHLDGSHRRRNGRLQIPLLDVIRNLGCVQLDPIRHVERTHRLVLWSRLGQFDETDLDTLRWQDRALFEYWAHAASLVLTEELPIHQYQMEAKRDPARSSFARHSKKWFDSEPDVLYPLIDHILQELGKNGPMLSREFEEVARYESRWSNGRYTSRVLDYLWSTGQIMVYGRPGNQRMWGLASEFWPEGTPQNHLTPDEVTAFATQKAIRALGVATPVQIKKHYTRSIYPNLAKVLKKLVADGTLERVQIVEKGSVLKGEWYLHQEDGSLLEQIQAGEWKPRTAILSPFDNLICDRDRTEQLWDFYYRIEIYVPKVKREFGYYVLPILHNDKMVGRIDSQMDRKTNIYHLNNVYAEPNAPKSKRMIQSLHRSIQQLAKFLGATDIQWGTVPDSWATLKD